MSSLAGKNLQHVHSKNIFSCAFIVPRVAPSSINVSMITHHSALMNWLPISSEDSNGAIIGYKIVLVAAENTTLHIHVTSSASQIEFAHVLAKLASNTTYRLRMRGYNVNGDGPESPLIYFKTKGKP